MTLNVVSFATVRANVSIKQLYVAIIDSFLCTLRCVTIPIDLTSKIDSTSTLNIDAELRELRKHCAWCCEMSLDVVWERLNTGHWSQVAVEWRRLFSYLSALRAIAQFAVEIHGEPRKSVRNQCVL